MSSDDHYLLYPNTISDVTSRGRWTRVYKRDHRGATCRYYVRVAGVRVRVPWLAWAMFS